MTKQTRVVYMELGACCEDCVQAIANDDYTAMDDATEARVRSGIDRAPGYLVVGDEQGFSHDRCDVCGGLAGDRHTVGYLVP